MSSEDCTIGVWINEERLGKLADAGLAGLTEDALAGMRVLQLPCTSDQRLKLLAAYPGAKYDAATTGSIELLPPEAKTRLFELVLEQRGVDVVDELLNSIGS